MNDFVLQRDENMRRCHGERNYFLLDINFFIYS